MQFLVIACALLGVALGQYVGYTGYPGWAGYQGHAGWPGYRGYLGYPGDAGYLGYPGYAGYAGYLGYPGYRGYTHLPLAVKPVESKAKEVMKAEKPVVSVLPALPALPALAPVVPAKTAYTAPYPAIRSQTQGSATDGSYAYSFETENGIAAAESSAVRLGAGGEEDKVVAGEYAYTSPEGVPVHVRYTADADGFHPEVNSPIYDGYFGAARSALPLDVVPVGSLIVKREEKIEEKTVAEKKEE